MNSFSTNITCFLNVDSYIIVILIEYKFVYLRDCFKGRKIYAL